MLYRPEEVFKDDLSKIFKKPKKALIFGATGQDGYYLTNHLLENGYEVFGASRCVSYRNNPLFHSLNYSYTDCDIGDLSSISRFIKKVRPDEIYNLAAQSKVSTSFNEPSHTFDITGKGCLNILEAIREIKPDTKFFQASSSEMFGSSVKQRTKLMQGGGTEVEVEYFQDEDTAFKPQNPYAIAKVAAHNFVNMYRDVYNIHASCGILFNHDSPKRSEAFLTKKVCKYIANGILNTNKFSLELGYLGSSRDWGWAEDFVKAMHLIVKQERAGDYIIATGETHTTEEFVAAAFAVDNKNWKDYVTINSSFSRPSETKYCKGDISKISSLGWKPTVTFKDIPRLLVEGCLHELQG